MPFDRLTNLLDVRYPIVQGGMAWVSRHELAAAVSEAGALGVIGSGGMDAAELLTEIRALRSQTSRSFAVNVPLVNVRPDHDDSIVGQLIEVALDEQVPIVITSGGSPKRFTRELKEAGVTVIHVVPSARLALKCQDAGVDAIVAEGFDAGGHLQRHGLSTFSLVPQVVDAVSLPVIAAGGVSDARGIAAALALGADGVQLGTRFIATSECNAHAHYKGALLAADSEGTAVYCNAWHPSRALKNPIVERMVAMDEEGHDIDEIRALRGRTRARAGCIEGDVEEGILPAGAAAGLVHEVRSAAEVVADLVRDYEHLLAALPAILGRAKRAA